MGKNSFWLILLVILSPKLAIPQELLSLEDAIRIGLENSHSIQISRNNVEIAKNNNTPGNAGYLPRIDLSANESNTFQNIFRETTDGTSTNISMFPTYYLGSGAQLSWTIFDGFAMFVRKEKLGLYEDQSNLYLRMEIENTVADIVYTYYSIAQNEKLLKSYEDQMALSRQRLMIAREKSKIGVGFELQELQSEVDFRADSAQYMRQSNRLINLKADLNRLLIRKPETEFSINLSIPVPKPISVAEVYKKVADNNPSMVNARLIERIGELEVREAKSSRYPAVYITGAYNFNRTGTPNVSDGQTQLSITHGPNLGVGASINLFNGSNVTRRIRNAEVVAENQRLSQEDLTLRLHSTAFKLVNELNQAIELVEVEEKSVILAQRNAEASWEKYRLGSISDLELRESQNKLLDAQTRLISAQMNAQAAEISLLTLTGDIGEVIR